MVAFVPSSPLIRSTPDLRSRSFSSRGKLVLPENRPALNEIKPVASRRVTIRAAASAPDAPLPPPSNSDEDAPRQRGMTVYRLIVFGIMSLTYSSYVFLRSTFTYVAPSLANTLGFSLSAIGKISSAFPLAYGMSRLVTGLIVDRTSPHIALSIGLMLAGIVNVAMGASSTVPIFALLWGMNGLVQGVGAGASAKMLTSWFSPRERGFYWALWSSSANVGSFFAPIVCASLAASAGFRYGLVVPGLVAAIWAVVVLPFMRSSPSSAGFSVPWEDVKKGDGDSRKKENSVLKSGGRSSPSWRKVMVESILKNRTIWCLAISYFFVYLIRNGTKSWLHFWLVDERGYDVAAAAARMSGMEVGGIAGTFSAGVVSDLFGGRRVLVTILYLIGMMSAVASLWALPHTWSSLDFVLFAAVGFMINGPQMMIGLIGAEVCDRRVVATATGFLGWISYLGAAASGLPLSVVIGAGGWSAFFAALVISCACAALFLAPLWRLRAADLALDPKR